MASFSDRLGDWKPPTAEDLEISLPPRREVKKELPSEEPHERGQHGGGSDGASADVHGDAGTGAAEPAPQRDDPDEGEHTDSTQEQVAARIAQRAAETATEPEAEPKAELEQAPVDPQIAEPAPAVTPSRSAKPANEPEDVSQALARTAGSQPRPFTRIGFSVGEDTKTVLVKKIPKPLVDRLRLLVAPVLGGEFAEQISAPALVSAYLSATTGVELDMDENTEAAADVFRQHDPRIAAVEDRLESVLDGLGGLTRIAERTNEHTLRTASVADALEFGVSFLVTDRVAGLSTADMNETNVDVTSKKVLTARETIRARTKEQRTIEKQRDGRSIA